MELLQNTQYEVLTSNGFENFLGLKRVTRSSWYRIRFEDGGVITCTPDHVFFINGVEYSAKNLKEGDVLDGENKQLKLVVKIEDCNTEKEFYDLVEVKSHKYYANGVEIHNCDCDFSTSGNTVIDPDTINFHAKKYNKDPEYKRGFDNNLWIWEQPDYTKNYIVTADVARGDGSDYSAFHIMDVESCRQVAEYRGQISTKDFGNMLVAIATEYNDALLVPENANVGWATIQQIIERGYKNLYYTYKNDVLDSDKFLTKGYDLTSKTDMVAGFTMSHKVRPLLVSKLELYLREDNCIIRSKRLMDELLVFIWKGGRAEAASGYHDDLVMSFAQGLWVRDTALRLRQAGIELNRLAVSSIRSAAVYKPVERTDIWKQPDQRGNLEDITWLL